MSSIFQDEQKGLPGIEDKSQGGGYIALAMLAKLFDLTERRIQQLAEKEIIPKGVNGQYPIVPCIKGYIAYLKEQAQGQGSNKLTEERVTHESIKRQIAAIELQKLRGEVVEISAIEHEWGNLFVTLKTRMRLIPRKIIQQLIDIFLKVYHDFLSEDISMEIRQFALIDGEDLLTNEIDEALNEIAEYDPGKYRTEELSQGDQADNGAHSAASEADGQ